MAHGYPLEVTETRVASRRRVFITGVGPLSAIGSGRQRFWAALLAGTDGSSRVTRFDTSGYRVHRACELRGFVPPAGTEHMGPISQYAIAAGALALSDAGLTAEQVQRAGVVIGTTGGDLPVLERIQRRRQSGAEEVPEDFHQLAAHAIAANVGRRLGLGGPNQVVAGACAAGNYALTVAYEWIQSERAERVLAGGADPLSPMPFTGFARLLAIAPDVCRPFDKNRKGILLGEGAGLLVLESAESARRRGARVYAELLDYGLSCDAYHATMPHPEAVGMRNAMHKALAAAGVAPEDVDYVSAHGTGTRASDPLECTAVGQVFARNPGVPISSIKSMIGHSLAAASAFEAISCALAIDTGWIPPTIHHETPDPACDVDCVPNRARERRVRVTLNNAFAFGGNNCCVVFARA